MPSKYCVFCSRCFLFLSLLRHLFNIICGIPQLHCIDSYFFFLSLFLFLYLCICVYCINCYLFSLEFFLLFLFLSFLVFVIHFSCPFRIQILLVCFHLVLHFSQSLYILYIKSIFRYLLYVTCCLIFPPMLFVCDDAVCRAW